MCIFHFDRAEAGVFVIRDGKLSVREFEEYYERVSAEIESDEHFAVMIANAWKL